MFQIVKKTVAHIKFQVVRLARENRGQIRAKSGIEPGNAAGVYALACEFNLLECNAAIWHYVSSWPCGMTSLPIVIDLSVALYS